MQKYDKTNGNDCLQRIVFIVKLYKKWIDFKQNKTKQLSNVNMYDIIENEFGDNYNVQTFLRDYRYIVCTKRDAFGYDDDDEQKNDNLMFGFECDINDCYVMNRNNRNRSEMTRFNNKRNEMFFVSNKNNDDSTKSVIIQQIMDSLHCWVYHSLKLNFSKYMSDKLEESKDNQNEIICVDIFVQNFGEIIQQKRE